jgi:hypothetical protein
MLARKAGGVSKAAIMGGATYARTRENMSEFGGAAKAGKGLRLALSPVMRVMGDGKVVQRATSLMKQVANLDTGGLRGRRSVLVSQFSDAVKGFELNQTTPFSVVCSALCTLAHETGRRKGSITINGLNPQTDVQAPAGATHYSLVQLLGVMGDYSFDEATGAYQPADAAANSHNAVTRSVVTGLADGPQNFTLATTLPAGIVPGAGVKVLQCIGIEFYQRINGGDYLLPAGNAMRIAGLF